MTTRRGTTAADLAAAVKVGAIRADAVVLTEDEANAATAAAIEANRPAMTTAAAAADLSTTDHGCGIVGCRHGAAHGPSQPDRQMKLTAECGAVVRMTARAFARAGGGLTDAHGHQFAIDTTRRAYNRKGA